jgi:hypothetical protein
MTMPALESLTLAERSITKIVARDLSRVAGSGSAKASTSSVIDATRNQAARGCTSP